MKHKSFLALPHLDYLFSLQLLEASFIISVLNDEDKLQVKFTQSEILL